MMFINPHPPSLNITTPLMAKIPPKLPFTAPEVGLIIPMLQMKKLRPRSGQCIPGPLASWEWSPAMVQAPSSPAWPHGPFSTLIPKQSFKIRSHCLFQAHMPSVVLCCSRVKIPLVTKALVASPWCCKVERKHNPFTAQTRLQSRQGSSTS